MPRKYKLAKGILIAIEGIDGAGKTTQVLRLRNYFSEVGIPVANFKEPTDGEYGNQIRTLSRHGRHLSPKDEFEIFLNDRIEDCKLNINPALEQNKLVLMDRYYFSNIAYQSVLGLEIDYIVQKNEEIAPIPDLVIILDVAAKVGLNRILYSRKEEHNHFEREDYLNSVRKVFRNLDAPYIQLIDATADADTIFSQLKNIIQDMVAPHRRENYSQFDLFEKAAQKENLVRLKN